MKERRKMRLQEKRKRSSGEENKKELMIEGSKRSRDSRSDRYREEGA